MRKRFIIGGVIVIIGFSVLISAYVNHENKKAATEEYIVVEQEEDDVPLDGEIPGQVIPQEDLQAYLNERLTLAPANVLAAMQADGWQVVLTTENLSERYFQGIYSNVSAVTDSTIKTIWINSTQRAITKSTLHEMGHYLDYKFGIVNRTDEFQKIYEAEKATFRAVGGNTIYARSSSQEYFGEAFQQCILHPESMQENAPMTYAFIMALVNQL